MSSLTAEERVRRDAPKRVRKDLSLLWIDARCAAATMKRKPDLEVLAADAGVSAVIERIETELHGEAQRYHRALWACISVALMPLVLAGVAWSGLYILPVRILWVPFERGVYNLPWLSLYEWIAYLLLAAFFAYGFALVAESRLSTHRLSADYRRIADADAGQRDAFAREVVCERRQRTEHVIRTSSVFAAYRPLLDALHAEPVGTGTGAA